MTKAYSRFVSALFALFLGGMLVSALILPDRQRSEVENRTLAQWPEFSWKALKNGDFTAEVESYFADQFPLRDSWTGLKARSEQLIGKREFNGVYLCGNETLIAKVDPPFDQLEQKNLGYVKDLTAKTDIPVHFGLIPSAAQVWMDRLPTGAESWDQQAFLQQAEQIGVPMVDLHGALMAHRDEPIYYRTDHHWTTLGAFYGANAVLETLGQEPVEQTDFTPETASDSFCGTLYSTSGIHWLTPDTMEYWVEENGLSVASWRTGKEQAASLYDRTYLEKKDKYSSFLGGNQPLCIIRNTELPEGEKLLLVRDSYSDALAPFLAQRFSEVHLMDLRQYRASAAQYAAQNDIDRILVIYSIPNFITDRNIVFLRQ